MDERRKKNGNDESRGSDEAMMDESRSSDEKLRSTDSCGGEHFLRAGEGVNL